MACKEKEYSMFIGKVLISIGYAWETIQKRRELAKSMEHFSSTSEIYSNYGVRLVCAGSRREGSNTLLGGDSDWMVVLDEVIAKECVHNFSSEGNLTVLKLETDGTSPGYARLGMKKHGGGLGKSSEGPVMARPFMQDFIGDCCHVSDSGEEYVSSEIFIRTLSKATKICYDSLQNFSQEITLSSLCSMQPRAGPSIPVVTSFGIHAPHDQVHAIPCRCQGLLEIFLTRTRSHGWPPEDVLREISQLEAHVVPVGFKKSPHRIFEWRICFTKAEIRLIECLTEPQFHVFVLLKIFAKDVLKNVWDAMTSYVVKNVILWVVELTPGHRFRTDTVVDRFLACLSFLKICVKVGRLPSYMIPERNLLDLDQFVAKRPKLLSVLDDCLREKGSCLMRSRKLKDAMIKMYTSPESAIAHGRTRERIERAIVSGASSVLPFLNPTMPLQDIVRLPATEYESDMGRIIVERYTDDLEVIANDPVGGLRRIMSDMISHLR